MITDDFQQNMIADLIKLVNIPSVLDETDSNKPFGPEIDKALRTILTIADNLGFETFYDPEGYYGYAEIGEGEKLIGILGHLDIVPSGDPSLWQFPPFEGKVEDGYIYGRGVQDDKGPVITALYAMKALIDEGYVIRHRFRFIFGTDEENHWRGITRYMAREEIPCCGFTPDASFPLIYAEKGLLQLKITTSKGVKYDVKGGTALNAVPESAIYEGEHLNTIEKKLKQKGFDYERDGDQIIVIGRASHAAKPESGINAISRLALAIDDSSNLIRFLNERIGLTVFGTWIFGNCEDEISGKLTINVATIDMNSKGQTLTIDIRYPVNFSKKFILDAIVRNTEKYHLKVSEINHLAPNYVAKDSLLVRNLIAAYEKVTGLDGTPMSTGGATYARAMQNCVAFGPRFPGVSGLAHQTDERISIEHLKKSYLVYKEAIKNLNQSL